MRSVGKQARDESGKYPVNEDDEEKCQARISLAHLYVHSGVALPKMSREAAIAVPLSLRTMRSNSSHGIADGWIASSLALPCANASRLSQAMSRARKNANARHKAGHDVVFVDRQQQV